MKFLPLAVLSAIMLCPAAALAQAAPATQANVTLGAGTLVYDPQGGDVGKIESVNGDNVVLDTGTHKATLPKSAFGTGAKGPTISMTKAQIDAAVAASLAKSQEALTTALVPGAEGRGKAGAVVGKIKEINGDQVILDRTEGAVSLNKNLFTLTSGALTLGLTAAEFEAAAKAATAGKPSQ